MGEIISSILDVSLLKLDEPLLIRSVGSVLYRGIKQWLGQVGQEFASISILPQLHACVLGECEFFEKQLAWCRDQGI